MPDAPEVLVVGGGSTGCGIARDLSMRGLDVTLVEKGNLTHGTTGRMHGLLHSGGRYAVADQASAKECIQENEVLRNVASHCVEMTEGLFVKKPEDTEEYFQKKLRGCRDCDVPAEVLSRSEAREMEPHLASDIDKAIRVPDGAIDPFRLCVANALSAENHGARIETHAEVTDIEVRNREVESVSVEIEGRRFERLTPDYVVNATGAWAGDLGEMMDVEIEVRPSKGVMTVMNVRQVDTVINRCQPKGNADIVVPHETTCILGTTDVEVDDPEDYPEERWEVDLMIDELSELVPMLKDARTIRSYWGVRPLYEPPSSGTQDSEDITRDYFLLDHEERDDIYGVTSIVGGKFTTYRMMAEEVSDHVCRKLGVTSTCRTDETPLPGSKDFQVLEDAMDSYGLSSPVAKRSVERLGDRSSDVLDLDPNSVVCDCEAVTRAELQDAISQAGPDLNAVRIRTRASMGNCQGCFCVHKMANELHPEYDFSEIKNQLDSLYQERWKGQRHALWGEQLSQAMLTYAFHKATLNRDRHRDRDSYEYIEDEESVSTDQTVSTDHTLDYSEFDSGKEGRGSGSETSQEGVSRNGD